MRATKDVDCLSTVTPWILQENVLARLCTEGRLKPDLEHRFRYAVTGTDVQIDVLSPEGMNVGGGTTWLKAAVDAARTYQIGSELVRAATPPHFLALKLAALRDRGPDMFSAVDAEDIVTLAIEVPDLVTQVLQSGVGADVASLWRAVFLKLGASPTDIPDIVDAHLHRDDASLRGQAIETLRALVAATPTGP